MKDCRLVNDDMGRSKGFAFVEFVDRADAEDAIKKTDQKDMDGRMLKVNFSRPKGERREGGGRGGM